MVLELLRDGHLFAVLLMRHLLEIQKLSKERQHAQFFKQQTRNCCFTNLCSQTYVVGTLRAFYDSIEKPDVQVPHWSSYFRAYSIPPPEPLAHCRISGRRASSLLSSATAHQVNRTPSSGCPFLPETSRSFRPALRVVAN